MSPSMQSAHKLRLNLCSHKELWNTRAFLQACRNLLIPFVLMKLKAGSCTEISSAQICMDRNWQHFGAQVKRVTASQIPSSLYETSPFSASVPSHPEGQRAGLWQKRPWLNQTETFPRWTVTTFLLLFSHLCPKPLELCSPSLVPLQLLHSHPCSHGLWQEGNTKAFDLQPMVSGCHKHQEKWDHRTHSSKPLKGHFWKGKKKVKKKK